MRSSGGIEELIGESQGDLLFVLLLALVLVYLVNGLPV